jgi:N-acetylglucosamine-6-sulfatase
VRLRRHRFAFLVVALAAVAGLAGAAATAERAPRTPAGAAAERPNVLVVMTDDQTVESLRVMPNVQALLSARGATFENSFVTYSLCCPSRATFLTGQYPHNHGVRSNSPPTAATTDSTVARRCRSGCSGSATTPRTSAST